MAGDGEPGGESPVSGSPLDDLLPPTPEEAAASAAEALRERERVLAAREASAAAAEARLAAAQAERERVLAALQSRAAIAEAAAAVATETERAANALRTRCGSLESALSAARKEGDALAAALDVAVSERDAAAAAAARGDARARTLAEANVRERAEADELRAALQNDLERTLSELALLQRRERARIARRAEMKRQQAEQATSGFLRPAGGAAGDDAGDADPAEAVQEQPVVGQELAHGERASETGEPPLVSDAGNRVKDAADEESAPQLSELPAQPRLSVGDAEALSAANESWFAKVLPEA